MRKQSLRLTFLLSLILLGGCKKNEPIPVADFTFDSSVHLKAPCTVIFTNRSVNTFSYEWTFSDHDSVSADTNAVHTFLEAGTFNVKLRAFTQSRNEWASLTKTVTVLKQ